MPGSGNRSGGAAVRTAPAQTQRASVPLPAGVTATDRGGGSLRQYSFMAGGQKVEFTISDGTVGFEVGGSYDRGALSGRDADRAALTIMRIFKHDVSTRPDGFIYDTTAWTGDGFGAKRAAAYERAGFSAPSNGRAGGAQFGIVKGGKLTPLDPNSSAARNANPFASLLEDL